MWFELINYYGMMILIHIMFFAGLFTGLLGKEAKITINFIVGIVLLSVFFPLWWIWWIFLSNKK